MEILGKNLKYLRERTPKVSQQKIADSLLITRSSYDKYENNKVQPSIETLLRISKFYHISVDILLTVDISKHSLDELMKLPDNRILLPIIVDSTGENKIEIIPYKASMGYINGYTDPEYIESLQYMSLPFLRNGKYRAFPAEGDSMPPFKDGTYIIGDYVESIRDIKAGKTYLIVLQSGLVYKQIEQINKDSLTVKSKNSFFESYDIPFQDILEVWKFVNAITDEHDLIDLTDNVVKEMFLSLKEDMKKLQKQLDENCK